MFWFDKFIENIESENPLDIQIVEDHLNLNLEEDSDIVNEAESTIDIFKKYISGFDEKTVNKEKLEKKIVVEESADEISMSALLVDEGGKFNQQNLSSALKKASVSLVNKLL
jgi:hypothetical protein